MSMKSPRFWGIAFILATLSGPVMSATNVNALRILSGGVVVVAAIAIPFAVYAKAQGDLPGGGLKNVTIAMVGSVSFLYAFTSLLLADNPELDGDIGGGLFFLVGVGCLLYSAFKAGGKGTSPMGGSIL